MSSPKIIATFKRHIAPCHSREKPALSEAEWAGIHKHQ